MPWRDISTDNMRTPQNDIMEAYKEQKDLYTPDAWGNASKMEEQYKAFCQAKEAASLKNHRGLPEADGNADDPRALQNHAQRQSNQMLGDSNFQSNKDFKHPSRDAERVEGPITNQQLQELVWHLTGGDMGYHPIELQGDIENNFPNDVLLSHYQAHGDPIQTVVVEHIEEALQKRKNPAQSKSHTTTNDKTILPTDFSPSVESFITKSQLNKGGAEGAEVLIGQFSEQSSLPSRSPLVDPEESDASTNSKDGLINGDDSGSSTDNETRLRLMGEDGNGEKLLAENNKPTGNRVSSLVDNNHAKIEEDERTQERIARSGVQGATAFNNTRNLRGSSNVLQSRSALPPQVPAHQYPHQDRSLVPHLPMASGNFQPPRATVQGAKRGPKPYRPPPGIADVVEERLATSLQQLIPWLNANILPACAAKGTKKYGSSARPIVRVPEANKPRDMMDQLEKLLKTGHARFFRSFVENIIDQDRKRLGKSPAFKDTNEKKMGDGKADHIDAAVRKLLNRRIRDAKNAATAAQGSSAADSSGQVSSVFGGHPAIIPPQKIPTLGSSTKTMASTDHPSITAIARSPPYPAMPSTSYTSPFAGPDQVQKSQMSTAASRSSSSYGNSNMFRPTPNRNSPWLINSSFDPFDPQRNGSALASNRNGLKDASGNSYTQVIEPSSPQQLRQMGFGNIDPALNFNQAQAGRQTSSQARNAFQDYQAEQRGSLGSDMRASNAFNRAHCSSSLLASGQRLKINGVNAAQGFEGSMSESDVYLAHTARELRPDTGNKRKSDEDEDRARPSKRFRPS